MIFTILSNFFESADFSIILMIIIDNDDHSLSLFYPSIKLNLDQNIIYLMWCYAELGYLKVKRSLGVSWNTATGVSWNMFQVTPIVQDI
jgi:hypothetical protein